MSDYKNDIEKYIKGELTPSQMNALEKKALSDPFLADALEGAQSLKPDLLTADLNDLRASLNKRVDQPTKRAWVWAARIAAGLSVLAISTYFIVSQLNREDSSNLALNKQKEEMPAPEKGNANGSDSLTPKNQNLLDLQEPKKEAPKVTEPQSQSKAPESRKPEPPDANLAEDSQAKEETKVEAEQDFADSKGKPIITEDRVADAQPKDAPSRIKLDLGENKDRDADDLERESAKRKSAAGAASKTEAAFTDKSHRKIIRGKVTFSDDDTGLPGVNVMIKGTNEGVVTDAQGNYQISVDDSQSTLLFSFIGFSSKEVEVTSDDLNVQLDADISELSEVVVVGYGSNSDASNFPSTPPIMEMATPAGGRKAFKQYLEQNLKYPEQALKNQVEGKVTIQFSIGTTGQLSDFRVVRGLGFGCDEEVIRLIKDGPKWSPTKKNDEPVRDRVKVRMRFALPKK